MNLAFFHPVFPWEGKSLLVILLWILIPAAILVFGIVRLLFGIKKRSEKNNK